MMAEQKGKTLEDALERLRERMDKCAAMKPGYVDLHLSGPSGGEYRIGSRSGKTTISRAAGSRPERGPLLEVWGDVGAIRAIIDGEKNAVKQFLAGGMRVRGNLKYLSEVGVELGILDKPL
jgi:hypothetical protein